MLSLRVTPRSLSQLVKTCIHTSSRILTSKDPPSHSSSSSDSSDSSDSDSDGEKLKREDVIKPKESDIDLSDTNTRLNALLQQIHEKSLKSQAEKKSETSKVSNTNERKTLDVAIKPRKERFKKKVEEKKTDKDYEQQLVDAAKDVAQKIGGDTQKTELELLSMVLNRNEQEQPTIEQPIPAEDTSINLGALLSGMQVEKSAPTHKMDQKRQRMSQKLDGRLRQPSVAESLLHAKSQKRTRSQASPGDVELKVSYPGLGILDQLPKEIKDSPKLSTWDAMEVREIKLSTLTAPQNVFQELILWTEQGKLWNFPINNEQGMEEEQNVHFSEHVFMERHLKGWCPKKGPIRHFMELVCTGLSKNPYMTVEEKKQHITWYKDYFEDKKELLLDLGLLDNVQTPKADSKKEIEA